MDKLLRLIYYFLRGLIFRQAVKQAKKKGLIVYLKTLQGVRKGLAGSIFIFVFLQLMVFGFIGSLVTGALLYPAALELKLWILLSIFAILFVIPFTFLMIIFSERLWFKYSGAEQMIKEAEL